MTNSGSYSNRKDMTQIMLVQWSKFTNVHIRIKGSTLFTGVNGSGKSTILDALSYLLTGNTQFNKAAQDKDRSVLSYVRGDTRSNGSDRYLRQGAIVSYLAAEFWSPVDQEPMVVGVCIESPDETGFRSSWFVRRNAGIADIRFYEVRERELFVAPKNQLVCRGERIKGSDFLSKERGVEAVMRALGLHCDAAKYRAKLMKMMAFAPENNIDRFIAQSVLEPKPVQTIAIVREQKQKYDQIKNLYDNLLTQKEKLAAINDQINAYEELTDKLRFSNLLYAYQEAELARRKAEKLRTEQKVLERELVQLSEQIEASRQETAQARLRLRQAEDNCRNHDLDGNLRQVQAQLSDVAAKRKIRHKQVEQLKELMRSLEEVSRLIETMTDLSGEELRALRGLDDLKVPEQRKYEALLHLSNQLEKLLEQQMHRRVELSGSLKQLEQKLSALERQRQQLSNHKMVYDSRYEKERELLRRELKRQGLDIDVRFLCELVASVKDPDWQKALEVYLGRKRYHLIVGEDYCKQLMELVQRLGLRYTSVVLADQLQGTETQAGSAAELIEIPNPEGQKYINYLLNSMYLCQDLKELHDHPRGGLMKDGMLARGYTVARMPMDNVSYCLGSQAMELQLEQILDQLHELKEEKNSLQKEENEAQAAYEQLRRLRIDPDGYDLHAVVSLEELKKRQRQLEAERDSIESDPGFLDLIQKQKQAEEDVQRLEEEERGLLRALGEKENEKKRQEELKKSLSGEQYLAAQSYEQLASENEDLTAKVASEYQNALSEHPDGTVITQSRIQSLTDERKRTVHELEELQFAYGALLKEENGEGQIKRGVSYIPYYRTLLAEIGNVRAEETRRRLEEQHEKLESAFMNEFVSELVECIQNARREIDQINRELERLPFGNDVYTFKMTRRPDKGVFFKIADKISGFMNNLDAYMAMNRGDEELEQAIRDFMDQIMEDENEAEYADYRSYFHYDMEIVNRSSGREITTELSAKQGSASGGEKQTPYFIILAASLIQCYPTDTCCARLAFIDEAFSALSRERIERMVCYLEQNHFQVMYAAPPEKIGSIGTYIDSTVSLVETGRFTNAVEGLVKLAD